VQGLPEEGQCGGGIEAVAREDNDIGVEGVDDLDELFFGPRFFVAVKIGNLDDADGTVGQFGSGYGDGFDIQPTGFDETGVEKAEYADECECMQEECRFPGEETAGVFVFDFSESIDGEQEEFTGAESGEYRKKQQHGYDFSGHYAHEVLP
jgi:hypothetical protein